MRLILQLVLYCALFILMVRIAVTGGAVNGLYFYPKAVQERAISIGLMSRETLARKRKAFMIPFFIVMGLALVLIIGLWNKVPDFQTAYLQALLFLEVMNWYDGIVIDKIWVGTSKFWILKGCEDLPYIQTWGQVLKKRGILTLVWVFGALLVAFLVVWIF